MTTMSNLDDVLDSPSESSTPPLSASVGDWKPPPVKISSFQQIFDKWHFCDLHRLTIRDTWIHFTLAY
jgi:hypothetical protein